MAGIGRVRPSWRRAAPPALLPVWTTSPGPWVYPVDHTVDIFRAPELGRGWGALCKLHVGLGTYAGWLELPTQTPATGEWARPPEWPVSPPHHSYLRGGLTEGLEGPIEHHEAIPIELQWDGLQDTEPCSTGHWCHLGVTVYHQLTEILQAGQQPVKVHLGGRQ